MAKTSGSFKRKAVEVYTPERALYEMRSGVDIMAQYQVLRKRAEQRLRDLAAGGGQNLDVYRDYVNRFPRKSEIGKDARFLADAMAEVTRFLNLRESTIGGYREAVSEAEQTFQEHYGDELPSMDWNLFGEMMRAIKSHANATAYYRNWKKTYRELLSRADRAGLSQEELTEAIQNGEIRLGPKGGLLSGADQRYITRQWSRME